MLESSCSNGNHVDRNVDRIAHDSAEVKRFVVDLANVSQRVKVRNGVKNSAALERLPTNAETTVDVVFYDTCEYGGNAVTAVGLRFQLSSHRGQVAGCDLGCAFKCRLKHSECSICTLDGSITTAISCTNHSLHIIHDVGQIGIVCAVTGFKGLPVAESKAEIALAQCSELGRNVDNRRHLGCQIGALGNSEIANVTDLCFQCVISCDQICNRG